MQISLRQKVILLCGVAVLLTAAPGFVAAKEENPLRGDFQPNALQAKVGEIVGLALILEPLESFEKVRLTVRLSPGLEWIEGAKETEIPDLKAGARIELRYRFKVTNPEPQLIEATVEVLGLDNGAILNNLYLAAINRPPKKPYPTAVDDKGREIIVIEP